MEARQGLGTVRIHLGQRRGGIDGGDGDRDEEQREPVQDADRDGPARGQGMP